MATQPQSAAVCGLLACCLWSLCVGPAAAAGGKIKKTETEVVCQHFNSTGAAAGVTTGTSNVVCKSTADNKKACVVRLSSTGGDLYSSTCEPLDTCAGSEKRTWTRCTAAGGKELCWCCDDSDLCNVRKTPTGAAKNETFQCYDYEAVATGSKPAAGSLQQQCGVCVRSGVVDKSRKDFGKNYGYCASWQWRQLLCHPEMKGKISADVKTAYAVSIGSEVLQCCGDAKAACNAPPAEGTSLASDDRVPIRFVQRNDVPALMAESKERHLVNHTEVRTFAILFTGSMCSVFLGILIMLFFYWLIFSIIDARRAKKEE